MHRGSRVWVTAAAMLVMTLASMEATVTATAMPTIIGDLHGLEHYSWVASIYLLASTIAMPLYGRLADVWGRKRVIISAISLFAVASFFAAFSRSMGELILFRGIQGLGAGGIMPIVLTILGDIFTLKERARIQSLFSAVWGTASFAGPLLGAFLVGTKGYGASLPGFLHPLLGWPMIFWVNLPAGFLGMIVIAWKYHEGKHEEVHADLAIAERLDLIGWSWLAVFATTLLAGLSFAAGVSVPMYVPIFLVALALMAGFGFYKREQRAVNPIFPPSLMLQRSIGPSLIASGLLGIATFAVETYVPLYVQGGRGGTAGNAAATVTPVLLAWASSGIVAAPLVIRYGFRAIAIFGATLSTIASIALFITAILGAPLGYLTVILFVMGLGFGPASMAMLLAAQNAVGYRQRGLVTSGVTFFRNFGGAVGVGLFGALFNILSNRPLAAVAEGHFSPADLLNHEKLKSLAEQFPESLHHAQGVVTHALLWVFGGMAVAACVEVFICRKIPARKQEEAVEPIERIEAME